MVQKNNIMVNYYIADPAALQRPVHARRTIGLLLLGITIVYIPLAVLQHYSSYRNNAVEISSTNNNAAFRPERVADFQPLQSQHISLRDPTAELYRNFMHPARHLLESADSDELSVVVTFEDILKTIVFLLCAWLFALVFRIVGLPALVGEIVCGFVLGPPVLDFCPYPEAMVLIGNFGLIGLILDSGVNLDIAQLKETGSRAVILAVCGTVLAMSTGFGVGSLSKDNFQSALAIGAAFAPSSLGVASQVLAAGEVLNTPTGQLIVAASVVDDVLGLIMLSILEVFVLETPEVIDFLLPFISSFGFLIVLGYLGITWIPRILQQHILPRFQEENREAVSFALMFFMLTAYLPLLNYSGASYLTGAFLTGLSFSQIHFVHVAYTRSTKELMVWLMRIFFAATIGFQVPVQYFANPEVLKLAAGFLLPILAKLPLGLCVPRFQRDIPEGFPYDPYWRNVSIASLSMLCRGEFNFIVASFGLSVGLLDPEHYAAVVLAVLISCAMAPLALTQVIRYYNNKSKDFLDGHHPLTRIGKTNDGDRPLFLAIQARTPVAWGLQEKFTLALEKAGVIIIDHRSWHTLGLDAVDITEIFCQDKEHRVTVKACFLETIRASQVAAILTEGCQQSTVAKKSEPFESTAFSAAASDDQFDEIKKRCDELKQALIDTLGDADSSNYNIQVTQWETFDFKPTEAEDAKSLGKGFCFHNQPSILSQGGDEEQGGASHEPSPQPPSTRQLFKESMNASRSSLSGLFRGTSHLSENESEFAPGIEPRPRRSSRREQNISWALSDEEIAAIYDEEPHLATHDLWETDEVCHNVTREGYFMTPDNAGGGCRGAKITEGCPLQILQEPDTSAETTPGHRRRHHTFDAAQLESYNLEIETETIRHRLHGYVRP